MFCKNCGKEINNNAVICVHCGCSVGNAPHGTSVNIANASPYSKITALLLCFFLGGFGIHSFYVGKTTTGILQLLTLGGCGVWTLVDFIMIVTGGFSDAQGRKLIV
ncbi:MAG: TM2 domain-containing protein [Rikenellaceae bacterium]